MSPLRSPLHRDRTHPAVLAFLDAVAVFAVFNLVAWLRGVREWGDISVQVLLGPYLLLAGALYLIDGYRARTEMMSLDYTSQHLIACAAAFIGTLLLTFVVIPTNYPLQGSRAVIALSFVFIAGLTLSYRRSIHRWAKVARSDRTILFLGDRGSCGAFRDACRSSRLEQRVLCAYTDEGSQPPFRGPGKGEVSSSQDVLEDVAAGRLAVEAVVLAESSGNLPGIAAEELVKLYFAGVPTFTLELFYETYWRKTPLHHINHVWLFREGFKIARHPVFERLKRAADTTMAGFGLLLFSPLLAAAAVMIRLQDRGPVFFQQMRIGQHRRTFRALKLRTMTVGSGSSEPLGYTEPNDPRITRVGRWLRATRLDEVPQLWNVLKGEMSLIGPRAEWERLVESYERQIPCYHFRHLLRPGITGWAQVNYPYGASLEDTLRKLEYDLYYIRHFSFLLDASIVLKTIHLMLAGRGK